ncbi:HupE/UreJ family protein [Aureispira anguillae]|uniref:HupE/UreJ family protein n=1 Tax=Aureispira anguillae TaxID=2864201 RepID=A0A915YJM8_9BACT|nr:HupE/UreJ family protein [Aureispira anguillae]BDS14432.1 HupE/UreJ family protein [Aureispira anguillae]
MNDFIFFFKQGLSHISDLGAYDHILFITALAAPYSIKNWKGLFFAVTMFTIGHSISLILATLKLVSPNVSLIEFLIPVSIIATCLWNILSSKKSIDKEKNQMFHVEHQQSNYPIIILFGIIHGLGFSNYLRFILSESEHIFTPLLAFNIGLEIGQILILTIALLINFVLLERTKISTHFRSIFISILIILISIPILLETGKAFFFEG